MSKIVIIGQFDVAPGDSEQVAELMKTMMQETVKETGCEHYAFARDLTAPNRFQLNELWESPDALTAHFATAHMKTFRDALGKLQVEKRTVQRFEITAASDL